MSIATENFALLAIENFSLDSVALWVTGLAQRPPRLRAAATRLSTTGGCHRTRFRFGRRSRRGPLTASIRTGLQQVLMILHPVAVAPDVDDVAVVHQPVDEGRRHHLVAPFAAAPGIDAMIASRFRHTTLAFVPYRPQGRTTPSPRPLTSASPVQRLVAGPNLGPPPGLHDDFTAAPGLLGGGDQCGDIHRSRDARWRSLPA